jgi:hypothetical protein
MKCSHVFGHDVSIRVEELLIIGSILAFADVLRKTEPAVTRKVRKTIEVGD